MATFEADLQKFLEHDTLVWAISTDTPWSHQVFAEQLDLHYPVLSDLDGAIVNAYGVAGEPLWRFAKRSVFLVDKAGIIRYADRAFDLKNDWPELNAALEALWSEEP